MTRTRWSVALWICLLAAVFPGCRPLPSTQAAPIPPTGTSIVGQDLPPVALPVTESAPGWPSIDEAACRFTSSGDQVAGWHWLRDEAYRAYGEWTCSGLPAGANVPVILLALVADRAEGGQGYSTPVRVIYSLPSGDKSQAVQVYLQNSLTDQNIDDSRQAGYQATGYLVIPASFIHPEGVVKLRLERFNPSPYHVALKGDGLYFVSPRTPAPSSLLEGDLVSGWRWLRDPAHQDGAEWEFHGLDADAPASILALDVLVTQGADGGSGYNMPVKVTLANPSSGEQATFEQVQLTNLLFIQEPQNSGGAGYQAYGSLQFDSRLIDDQGSLLVRLERPLSTEYHLAVNQNTPGVVQLGVQEAPGDSQAKDQPTVEVPQDQAACEALGGRWGRVGLSPRELCNLPTTDGGKLCSDSSQCQSACIAELTQEQLDSVWRGGARIETTGVCAEWQIVVGCQPFVEDGVVQVICID